MCSMLLHVLYDSHTASNHAKETDMRNLIADSFKPINGYASINTISDISIYNVAWADNVPETSYPLRKTVSFAVLGNPKHLAFNMVPAYKQYLQKMKDSEYNSILFQLDANKDAFRRSVMSGAEFGYLQALIQELIAKDIPIIAWGGAMDIVNLLCGGVNLPINYVHLRDNPKHKDNIENRLMRLRRTDSEMTKQLVRQVVSEATGIPRIENCIVPYTRKNMLLPPVSANVITYHEVYSPHGSLLTATDSFITSAQPAGLPDGSLWYNAYLNITSKLNNIGNDYSAISTLNSLAHPVITQYKNPMTSTPNILGFNFNPMSSSVPSNGKEAIRVILTELFKQLD